MKVGVLTWDWKEQPDMQALARIVREIGGNVRIAEVDTGSDEYAVVVSVGEIHAEHVYEQWCADDNPNVFELD